MAEYNPPNNPLDTTFLLSNFKFQDGMLTIAYADSQYAPRQATINSINNLKEITAQENIDISTNKANIQTNKDDIATNKANIQTNKDDIATNKKSIDTINNTISNISYDGINTTIADNVIVNSLDVLNDCCISGSTSLGLNLATNNIMAANILNTNSITTNNMIVSENVIIGGSLHHKYQVGVYLNINNIQYPLIKSVLNGDMLYGNLNINLIVMTSLSIIVLPCFKVDIYNYTSKYASYDNTNGDDILYICKKIDIINIAKINIFFNNVLI